MYPLSLVLFVFGAAMWIHIVLNWRSIPPLLRHRYMVTANIIMVLGVVLSSIYH